MKKKSSYLRAKSRTSQWLRWLVLVALGAAVYVAAVYRFRLGPVLEFYGRDQLSIFVPVVLVVGILAYELRWDGVTRRRRKHGEREEDEHAQDASGEVAPVRPPRRVVAPQAARPAPAPVAAPQQQDATKPATPLSEALAAVADLSPEAAWEQARNKPHNFVPDPMADSMYLALVFHAAEGGHAEALAKLSDYAFRRGANVEAYFWASVAQKRGYAAAAKLLVKIRQAWMMAGSPGEYENAYDFFPETSGTVGRSLLRCACGIDVPYARQRLRALAERGNAYAKLFV